LTDSGRAALHTMRLEWDSFVGEINHVLGQCSTQPKTGEPR